MSKKQFFRLFIVAFLPLLILGVILENIVFEKNDVGHAHILCTYRPSFEQCKTLRGENKNRRDSEKEQYPFWFQVNLPDSKNNPPLYFSIEASLRSVQGAVIVKAVPLSGLDSASSLLIRSLVGNRAIVNLGRDETKFTKIYRDGALLSCNSLEFTDDNETYVSSCYGEGWAGNFTFEVVGQSRDELNSLRQAISNKISDGKTAYVVFRAIMYPIFIYLFLFISLLYWVVLKSARFVRGNDISRSSERFSD